DGEVIPGIMKTNGLNCVFYQKPNCSIYHNRPLACKNYPFTFLDHDNEIEFLWAKNAQKSCPGIGEGDLIKYSYIERNGKITSDNLNKHTNLIQELNTEAATGKPLTVREIIWIFIVYGEKVRNQN
ncbi:MAG: YkgJ family cysteine cluster protein, partial [Candidatus Hodarchaeales archaeon]